jgi:hypothetical protein
MEVKDDSPKRSPAQAPPSAIFDLGEIPLEEPEGGVFSAYSNVINLDWTLFDLRIRFSELTQVPNDQAPSWNRQHAIVLEHAAVRIPWYQAKHLRDQLDGVIRNYEAINGELKMPILPAAASRDHKVP